MALRLELRQMTDAGGSRKQRPWVLERGRRSVGRAASCDWQVEDDTRTVSKLHCTIEADRDGFVLRDESANGSKVDGVIVREGETARLADGSKVEIGTYRFEVSIRGEREPDLGDPDANLVLGDDNLTISSILADIAPAGKKPHGLSGSGDAWQELPETKPARSPSRNVEIGWDGPPRPDQIQPILPDNWYDESELSNTYEHGTATHVSVPRLKKTAAPEEIPAQDAESDAGEEATLPDDTGRTEIADVDAVPDFLAAEGMPAAASQADLQRIERLASRCGDACADIFASFDLDMPDFVTQTPDDDLQRHLETLLQAQLALKAALDSMIGEASHMFEPRIVEAQVDAEAGKIAALPLVRERSYWQAYKAHFDKDGASLSVRELLREAMLRSLRANADNQADEVGPRS